MLETWTWWRPALVYNSAPNPSLLTKYAPLPEQQIQPRSTTLLTSPVHQLFSISLNTTSPLFNNPLPHSTTLLPHPCRSTTLISSSAQQLCYPLPNISSCNMFMGLDRAGLKAPLPWTEDFSLTLMFTTIFNSCCAKVALAPRLIWLLLHCANL